MAAKKETITVEFAGMEFQADAAACRSWSVIRGISNGGLAMFDAFDRMFEGRADEYAEKLADDFADMANLAARCIEEAGSKN